MEKYIQCMAQSLHLVEMLFPFICYRNFVFELLFCCEVVAVPRNLDLQVIYDVTSIPRPLTDVMIRPASHVAALLVSLLCIYL